MRVCIRAQSGTHWLANVLSQIYLPGWTADDAAAAAAAAPHMASVPPMYKFHGFPVYWLLPGTTTTTTTTTTTATNGATTAAVVPDAVFDAVEAVPANVTRIFLSHMPAEHFEYRPAAGTKIFYLVREPHAVWGAYRNRKLSRDHSRLWA
jgi:hypothetical protein